MTAPDPRETIRSLETARYRAIAARDLDAFVELAHPLLAYTHSSGETDSLERYVEKCRTGFYVYGDIDHPVDAITVVGDTAIVVGEMHADITVDGVAKRLRNRCLAVWARTPGGWRFLAYQPTPMTS